MVESNSVNLRVDNRKLELTKKDKKLFLNLSKKMRCVSLGILIIEVPWTILAIFKDWNSFRSVKWFNDTISLVQIIVFLLIGYMTCKTASSFKKLISQTEGDDAKPLMQTLESMKNLYKVQRSILEITLVFLVMYILFIGGWVGWMAVWNRLQIGQ